MTEENEYLFGTEQQETERLEIQHEAWGEYARSMWDRCGIGPGQTVVDLGSGPGYTTFEIAERVGAQGRVIASEISERFVQYLRSECERRGHDNIDVHLGPAEEFELEDESVDVVYVRWLLSWLPDPYSVLERAARTVRPGGCVAIQEYLDWHCMKLMPADEVFAKAVEACRLSWPESGATIDIGEQLPGFAHRLGLEIEHFEPVSRIGSPGSSEWRWVGTFFRSYLPKLVERGFLAADDLAAVFEAWDRWEREGGVYLFTPTMVDVILRKA